MAESANNQSVSPSLKAGVYEALLVWGVLVVTILIVSFLLLFTPLGLPLKRRVLRLCGSRQSKEGYPTSRDHHAHSFQFRSPQLGTPAPPYEWVFSITPPPMAYMPSAGHASPVLTPRFAEIPRAEACHGLGINVQHEEGDAMEMGRANGGASELRRPPVAFSSSDVSTLAPNSTHISPSHPSLTPETASVGSLDAYSITEGGVEMEDGELLLPSHENATLALLESMSEEDRLHSLPLRTSSVTRF